MKLTNLLQLTEHHRFVVVRRFGLSPLDARMLHAAYQPMVGGLAVALYTTLSLSIPADTSGVSDAAALGQLFLASGLVPNEQGRKRLVEATSMLEAVGLLQTFRRMDGDEVAEYEFRLQPPLRPEQFFGVHHLWLLLQDKLGPTAAGAVRGSFVKEGLAEIPDERCEDISTPFYEVFRLHVDPSASAEAEEERPGDFGKPGSEAEFGRDGFRPDELLRRFPRSSGNRRCVERLVADAGQLARMNYDAGRFGLTLKQTVSLLDETGMFSGDGEWQQDHFRARAGEMYRQTKRRGQTGRPAPSAGGEAAGGASAASADSAGQEREVAQPYWLEVPDQFQGQCDVRQYNAMLVNSSYMRILKLFFQPSAVPAAVEEAFMAMNVSYQLPDEVINVLIHYIRVNDLDWKRNYLDAIGANLAGKRIRSFEHAVAYFRKEKQSRKAAGTKTSRDGEGARRGRSSSGKAAAAAKPVIPVVRPEGRPEATEEDIRRIMEIAKRVNDG